MFAYTPQKNERKKTKDYQYVITEDNKIEIFKYLGNAETVKIPSKIGKRSVTEIGSKTFENCKNLKTIVIPVSLKFFDDEAVYNCKKLTNITYTGTKEQWEESFESGIGNTEWMNLVEIHCKDGDIGLKKQNKDYKYDERNDTKSWYHDDVIRIVKYIGNSTKVKVPKTLKYTYTQWIYGDVGVIAPYAFKNCTKIKSVELPKTITYIGKGAFKNCTNLESIKIQTNIEYIGENAFENCKNLHYITYTGTKKQWNNVICWGDYYTEIHCKDGIIPGKSNETQLKSVKASKKSFKATWTKADNVSEYQVQYATDTKFKKNKKTITITNPKTTSITVNKLKSKQKYYVQVRTYRKWYNSSKKSYSDWCSLEGVHVK